MRAREILAYHAVGAAVVVLSVTFGGVANAEQDDAILFRTETRLVEVTVVATDREGRLVNDLKPEEIRVFDKGDEQRVQHFDVVPTASSRGAVDLRHTIFLIDDLNSDADARARIRAALADVFPSGIRAEDRISIIRLGAEGRVLVEFGQDVRRLQVALDEPPGVLRAIYDAVEIERRIAATARLLSVIAKSFENTPGQKNLVWISAGFPLSLILFDEPPYGSQLFLREPGPLCPPHVSPLGVGLEYFKESPSSPIRLGCGARSWGASDPSPVNIRSFHGLLLPAINELNAANVSLYAVDAGGLRYGDSFGADQAMSYLARQTGGVAYADRGDTTALIQQSLDDSRTGYVLTYAPKNYVANAAYHRIRVKANRAGVKLRYRRGYLQRDDEPQP